MDRGLWKVDAKPTHRTNQFEIWRPSGASQTLVRGFAKAKPSESAFSPCFEQNSHQATSEPPSTPHANSTALLDSTIQYQETSTPLPLSLLLPLYIIFRHQNNMNVNNNQKKAPPPAGNMGLANKTVEGDGTSTKYLDEYLTIYDQWTGVNKLTDVKEEHVEGEWLKMFWLNFAYWMAITPLKKEIGEGYLDFIHRKKLITSQRSGS